MPPRVDTSSNGLPTSGLGGGGEVEAGPGGGHQGQAVVVDGVGDLGPEGGQDRGLDLGCCPWAGAVGGDDAGEGQLCSGAGDGAGEFVATGPADQTVAVEGDPRLIGVMVILVHVVICDGGVELPSGPIERDVGFGDLSV